MDEIPQEKPKFVFPTALIGTTAKKYKPPTSIQILKKRRVSLEGVEGSITDARNYRGVDAPNGHWQWDGAPLGGSQYTGFIYVIRDTNINRLYLGKKQYRGTGKLNKGQESNWRWYISSSTELSNNVKATQKTGFEYYAIEEYKAKGALSFAETWSLCHVEAPCNQHMWYNKLINKVSWVVHEGITERHKQRLSDIIAMSSAEVFNLIPQAARKEVDFDPDPNLDFDT